MLISGSEASGAAHAGAASQETGIPLVATNDAHYLQKRTPAYSFIAHSRSRPIKRVNDDDVLELRHGCCPVCEKYE